MRAYAGWVARAVLEAGDNRLGRTALAEPSMADGARALVAVAPVLIARGTLQDATSEAHKRLEVVLFETNGTKRVAANGTRVEGNMVVRAPFIVGFPGQLISRELRLATVATRGVVVYTAPAERRLRCLTLQALARPAAITALNNFLGFHVCRIHTAALPAARLVFGALRRHGSLQCCTREHGGIPLGTRDSTHARTWYELSIAAFVKND